MDEIVGLKELGLKEDDIEVDFTDEEDGGARIDVYFTTYVAEEVFRAACARAGISQEEYLRKLLGF